MATPLNVPKLGVAMTEGELVSFNVADGAEVQPGDVVYTIATDKVETDIDAPVAGILRHIGVEGETYAVGELVAEIE